MPILVNPLSEQNDLSGWDGLAQSLSGLRFREFWQKQRGAYRPSKQRTFDMRLPDVTNEVRHNIRSLLATSGRLYGRPRNEVQKEVAVYHRGNQVFQDFWKR